MSKKIGASTVMFSEQSLGEYHAFVTSIKTQPDGQLRIDFRDEVKTWWICISVETAIRIGFINLDNLQQYCQ